MGDPVQTPPEANPEVKVPWGFVATAATGLGLGLLTGGWGALLIGLLGGGALGALVQAGLDAVEARGGFSNFFSSLLPNRTNSADAVAAKIKSGLDSAESVSNSALNVGESIINKALSIISGGGAEDENKDKDKDKNKKDEDAGKRKWVRPVLIGAGTVGGLAVARNVLWATTHPFQATAKAYHGIAATAGVTKRLFFTPPEKVLKQATAMLNREMGKPNPSYTEKELRFLEKLEANKKVMASLPPEYAEARNKALASRRTNNPTATAPEFVGPPAPGVEPQVVRLRTNGNRGLRAYSSTTPVNPPPEPLAIDVIDVHPLMQVGDVSPESLIENLARNKGWQKVIIGKGTLGETTLLFDPVNRQYHQPTTKGVVPLSADHPLVKTPEAQKAIATIKPGNAAMHGTGNTTAGPAKPSVGGVVTAGVMGGVIGVDGVLRSYAAGDKTGMAVNGIMTAGGGVIAGAPLFSGPAAEIAAKYGSRALLGMMAVGGAADIKHGITSGDHAHTIKGTAFVIPAVEAAGKKVIDGVAKDAVAQFAKTTLGRVGSAALGASAAAAFAIETGDILAKWGTHRLDRDVRAWADGKIQEKEDSANAFLAQPRLASAPVWAELTTPAIGEYNNLRHFGETLKGKRTAEEMKTALLAEKDRIKAEMAAQKAFIKKEYGVDESSPIYADSSLLRHEINTWSVAWNSFAKDFGLQLNSSDPKFQDAIKAYHNQALRAVRVGSALLEVDGKDRRALDSFGFNAQQLSLAGVPDGKDRNAYGQAFAHGERLTVASRLKQQEMLENLKTSDPGLYGAIKQLQSVDTQVPKEALKQVQAIAGERVKADLDALLAQHVLNQRSDKPSGLLSPKEALDRRYNIALAHGIPPAIANMLMLTPDNAAGIMKKLDLKLQDFGLEETMPARDGLEKSLRAFNALGFTSDARGEVRLELSPEKSEPLKQIEKHLAELRVPFYRESSGALVLNAQELKKYASVGASSPAQSAYGLPQDAAASSAGLPSFTAVEMLKNSVPTLDAAGKSYIPSDLMQKLKKDAALAGFTLQDNPLSDSKHNYRLVLRESYPDTLKDKEIVVHARWDEKERCFACEELEQRAQTGFARGKSTKLATPLMFGYQRKSAADLSVLPEGLGPVLDKIKSDQVQPKMEQPVQDKQLGMIDVKKISFGGFVPAYTPPKPAAEGKTAGIENA